jgi:hypothetical protein
MNQQSELRALLAAVRQRWFRLVALRSVARATAWASAPVLAAVALDRLVPLHGLPLVLLAAATLVLSFAAVGRVIWRMQRRPDDRRVARFVEEHAAGEFDDALVSAVDVIESPSVHEREMFVPLILADAIRRLRAVDPARIVDPPAIRRAALEAGAGVVLLLCAAALSAPSLSRAVEAARVRFFPGSIALDVQPGDARIAAGAPFRVRAVLHGRAGDLTHVTPSLEVGIGADRRSVEMVRAAGAFEFTIDAVTKSFTYTVAAGSARSREYTVTALTAPRVKRIDLHYAYPAFSGLASRDEQDGGDIYAPSGTRVRLQIHTDRPVTSGTLAVGAAGSALRIAGDRLLEGEIILTRDDSYRVALADADGLRSRGSTEYFIRLMNDRPPDVRILRPSGDQQITPLEEVSIEARADDDYGITAFDLVYSVGGGPERTVAFDRTSGTDIQKVGVRLIAAEDLNVKPGDVITYYARVRDVAHGKRSTEAKSDIFFLEVKPFTEEFTFAESQALGAAGGQQIENLIAAQKEIIAATWNIERRAEAGRSAADVKAIEQAQAELKTKAEQLISRTTRRRGPGAERIAQPPRPQPRPAGADPVGQAIEAMTRAVQQLQTQKTADAIPHEMAALNGLLQAQAEVRRRQVSQQTGGGGNGISRSGQDLTSLFDKELQRQQRTNYEQRSQVEERPDQQKEDSALDRIRDLARRQEDLSRRQRELAEAGLSADEMKRQLEKLTREQQELRQQAEDLEKELSQRQPKEGGRQGRGDQQSPSRGSESQGQSSGRQGQPSPGGTGGLKEALDEMRSAASDLRRDDPTSAAKSGERAADELRRVEQQMKAGSAAANERAQGEVQLEAQQIAQEQRRIASEAERLEKNPGGAGAEAARRLADEKDRLARRVDDLQRALQQVAKDKMAAPKGKPQPQGGAAAADAAREIERERIGQRMRETAQAMRDGAGGRKDGRAQAEQQIARALDRVVGTLGGNASAEARELSEQLNRTAGIRDRLNSLEQQMREAEAREKSADKGAKAAGSKGASQAKSGKTGGDGKGGSELDKLRQDYQRELQRAKESLGRLSDAQPRNGLDGATPEQQEFSRSAPGTEAWKQDRSGWDSLRKEIDLALEKYEATVSDRLAKKPSDDRFSAGGSERVPESYRQLIARYYESLAKARK